MKEAHKEYPPADSPVDEKSLPSRPQKPAKRNSGEDGPDKKKRRKVSGEGQKSGAKSRKTMDLKLRQVKASPSSDDEAVALAAREEVEGTESRNATPDPQKQRKKRPTIESSPAPASTPPPPKEESEAQDDELENSISQTKGAKPTYGLNDESDLSSLEDDSPPPKAKQRKRKSGAKEDKPSKVKFPKAEAKGKLEATPQGAAVKKLQGQLAKCGVRKVWGNYLKNYETPKQKIAHLRSMLEDVGMTGRFSEDKARQIKEERELKADIDAITEGEKKWGKAPEETGGKRLAKGLQELEGLVDEDGESE